MADTAYAPDTDEQVEDPGGLRAFLTRGGGSAEEDDAESPVRVPVASPSDISAVASNATPPANPAVAQQQQATGAKPTYTAPTDQQLQQPLAQTTAAPATSYASQAPKYTAPDDAALQAHIAQRTKDSAPIDPKTVSPKWYERLGGALVGGAMAFDHQPGALQAGSAVTNQRATAAAASRQGKIDQDNQVIQEDKDAGDRQAKEYERQLQGYRATLEGAGADETATRDRNAQANSDRTYGRETANDTREQGNKDRDYKRDISNDKFDQGFKERQLKQTGAYQQGELGVSRQRLKDDEDDKGTTPAAKNAKLQTQISQKYGDAMDKLENGDPKGASDEEKSGFKTTYRKAASSATNPETLEAWKPGEQQQYLESLKQQNADRKNSIMSRQRDELSNAGRSVPLIQYDADGKVVSAPASGGGSATPAANAQQQAAPQTTKVKAGTLKVGDPVVYNGKRGTVTGINAAGKPIVNWGQ